MRAVLFLHLLAFVAGPVCLQCSFRPELSGLTFGKGLFGDAEVIERPVFDFGERHRVREFVMPDGTGEKSAIIVANVFIIESKEVSLEAVHSWAIHNGDHGEGARFKQ
ncbi:hypothetical protein DP107_16820 [Haloglomus irregulare]|uniref:Uncharacterized protein n=1 Tax=Haloglomus irregulare TaxID=2234134 RepID=A0A554MVN6_9EURY|nr:hypothetical protein [Haloglomus irregulare]TSD09188.1 hypothetical protein DP107_16820 [Haloglomus irregulare]